MEWIELITQGDIYQYLTDGKLQYYPSLTLTTLIGDLNGKMGDLNTLDSMIERIFIITWLSLLSSKHTTNNYLPYQQGQNGIIK